MASAPTPPADNIQALKQWADAKKAEDTGVVAAAPEATGTATVEKKPARLKFSISNAAIRKMAASTLKEGGLDVSAESSKPRAPIPAPARPSRDGLSGAFNAAASGRSALQQAAMNNNNDVLAAMIQSGADIVAPTRPSAKPRYFSPSPSI